MKMVPVASSNLSAIGYDADTLTLRVSFSGGATWEYGGIIARYHDELMAADSKGSWLRKFIIPCATSATKVSA